MLLLFPALVLSEGDPGKGKTIYTTCAACHGQNGEGLRATNSPRLAGQQDWYLIRQLQNFKAGIRGDLKDKFALEMRMRAKVDLQNDQVIKDVAAYLSTL